MGIGMTNGTGKTGWYAKKAYETAASAKDRADEAYELAEDCMERILATVITILPAQDGTLTYDGTEQTVTWKNVEPGSLIFGGVQAATNAGSYTATCKPTKDYKWEDQTQDTKNIVWSIERQPIYDVPTQSGAIGYDGQPHSPQWNNLDTDKMTLGGITTGTDVGTYNATVTPKNNYKWYDGSVEPKTITWTISAAVLTVPEQDGTLTYDGTEQTPTLDSNYDSTLMALSGTTEGTNAGTYTMTVALTDNTNYKWADGTITNKTITWTIGRSVISAVPSQDGSLTYNNTTQTVNWINYNSNQLTQGGTLTGVDAGTYIATFTPKANYQWGDASGTDAKEVSWTIGKAAGGVTLSKYSVSLDADTLTDTITVTRLGDGTVSASSSASGIATATYSAGTVTIEAVDSGSATVTISAAEGTNHLAASTTIAVTVALAPPISNTLNENSWDAIAYVAQEGTGDTYWDVGDCKEITLNGKIGANYTASNQKLCVFILDFNHKDNNVASNNIIWGGFKTALTGGKDVALMDFSDGSYPSKTDGTKQFNFNHWGNYNYGGWKGSDLRYDILGATSTAPSGYGSAKTTSCVGYDATAATLSSPKADTFLAALPSDLRSKIRLRTHYVDNKGNSSNVDANVTAVTDAVFLLAEFEIFGTRSYANQYEQNHQAQMKYYKDGNSKIKYESVRTGTAARWWEASPSYNYANLFCIVNSNGSANGYNAGNALGLAPAFMT